MPFINMIIGSGGGGASDNKLAKSIINGSVTTITEEDLNGINKIKDYAFAGCNSLASITIPNSVTNIGNYAFFSCTALTSITIPNSVTTIENYTFAGCDKLTSITINKPANSISGAPWGATNATVTWTS
jgi:hypothetical protein